MILVVNEAKTLGDLGDKFNECFPHLKLQFYKHRHHWKESSSSNEELLPDKKIADINPSLQPGYMVIKSWDKIGKVEQDFHRRFGLNVQVFRNENDVWMLAPDTDTLGWQAQKIQAKTNMAAN